MLGGGAAEGPQYLERARLAPCDESDGYLRKFGRKKTGWRLSARITGFLVGGGAGRVKYGR